MPAVDTDRFSDNAFAYQGRTVLNVVPASPVCDCGCWASVKINNEPKCWDCAEEEGVERIRE